jgi:hypothetical protein
MGAASSVLLDQLNEDAKESLKYCEHVKNTISEYDAAMLDREHVKIFKKHANIIKTLTSRTKSQLRRTLLLKQKVPDDIYKIVGGNNNYATFMKSLHMLKHEIEMENLKIYSPKELYDEEMLINIIGTSSNKELKLFSDKYVIEKGATLAEVFESKTKPGSQLQRFVAMTLNMNRDESRNPDPPKAAEQAAAIHAAGAAKLMGCDEEVIFNILIHNSRAQCALIADSYLTQFHVKFERAINMKFKGNCAKLMLLWALPLPSAVATCLHAYEERMLIDKVAIITMIAKYDKDFLSQADIAAEKIFEKNLLVIVQRGLSGNLLNAVSGWLDNATPDKGYERVTEMFIESQQGYGRTLEELVHKEEFQQRLLFLFKKQEDELAKYAKENRIKLSANNIHSLPSMNTMDSFDAAHSKSGQNIAVGDAQKEVLTKYSVRPVEDKSNKEYDVKYLALQEYLNSFFTSHDVTGSGFFPEAKFWAVLKVLPLELLGLSEKEVSAMEDWSEWVIDGKVNYHETVFELADSLITSIEAKKEGDRDVLVVVEALKLDPNLKKAEKERKVGRHDSMETITAVPDYFLQYLYDTFSAYDFDNNGYLCKTELDSVLPVLNISMTVSDFIGEEEVRFQ